jgi:hypothetical protein
LRTSTKHPRNGCLAYSCRASYLLLCELAVPHYTFETPSEVHDKCILMHTSSPRTLPVAFCWTRFGAEAGESSSEILVRKEAERQAGGGVFYWGIGSAVGPALETLIGCVDGPEVLFSPIASRPRQVDVSPTHIVRWSAGQTLSGKSMPLPRHAWVTSRWDPERPGAARYALVCRSDEPLNLEHHGELSFGSLRNLRSGTPIGASQVTAVVRYDASRPGRGRAYAVALRASLVSPYLLRLVAPELIERPDADAHRSLPLALSESARTRTSPRVRG